MLEFGGLDKELGVLVVINIWVGTSLKKKE